MVNMTRRFLIVAALLLVGAVQAFAYDGTVFYCEYEGNYSRYEFINEVGSGDFGTEFQNEANGPHSRVVKFFQIDENSCDEEDVDVINNIPSYLTNNFRVGDGSTFTTGVWRGDTDSGKDGWLIVSNYTSARGWLHYMYYFAISYF